MEMHGLSSHPFYSKWGNMRSACNNPKNPHYKNYGAKGIKVCERWNSFKTFLKDMGDPPSPHHGIKRHDETKNFTPENCYWGFSKEQHGLSGHPIFRVWVDMKHRCSNPNHAQFYYWGGRGIKVCDRWENSFPNFLKDMGDRPTPQHQIDRINNDLGYFPENCRWATPSENQRNKRPMPGQRPVQHIETGKIYPSQAEAARQNPGLTREGIRDTLNGRQKSTKGTHWRYADQAPDDSD